MHEISQLCGTDQSISSTNFREVSYNNQQTHLTPIIYVSLIQLFSSGLTRDQCSCVTVQLKQFSFCNVQLDDFFFPFSALTLLVGRQEVHPACKNVDVVLLVMTF